MPIKVIEFVEGCIAGAGIGFCLGALTMNVDLPYLMAMWGMPMGGVLFCFLSRSQLRFTVFVLAALALLFALNACGEKRPEKPPPPPCKLMDQANITRCGVRMFQDPDTGKIYAQPGEIKKVRTFEYPDLAMSQKEGCLILDKGVYSQNPETSCGFLIKDGKISEEGKLYSVY